MSGFSLAPPPTAELQQSGRRVTGILSRTDTEEPMAMWTLRLAVLLLAAALPADAQGTALRSGPAARTPDEAAVDDIVVVTASRREEQLLNAPATMSVLTEDVFGHAPGQTLTDLPARARGQHGPILGARRQRHDPRRDGHAFRFIAGSAGRALHLPGLLRVRRMGFPADRSAGDQADRGDSRPGVGCVGRECHDRRGQCHHENAARDAGHERVDSIRPVRPLPDRRCVRRRGTFRNQRHARGGAERQVCLQGVGGRADAGIVFEADRDCSWHADRLPRVRKQRNLAAKARCARGLPARRWAAGDRPGRRNFRYRGDHSHGTRATRRPTWVDVQVRSHDLHAGQAETAGVRERSGR